MTTPTVSNPAKYPKTLDDVDRTLGHSQANRWRHFSRVDWHNIEHHPEVARPYRISTPFTTNEPESVEQRLARLELLVTMYTELLKMEMGNRREQPSAALQADAQSASSLIRADEYPELVAAWDNDADDVYNNL